MTGPDPRDPLALPHTGEDWARIADHASIRGLRVAWTPDLGGAAAVDPGVAAICRKAARVFPELGCSLEDASPEIGNIRDPFLALNTSLRLASIGNYLDQWRDQMDPNPVRRLELRRSPTIPDVARAEVQRAASHHRPRPFLARHDLVVLPTAALPALPLG